MALPAWYPDPAETKPAPGPLLLVQAFLNTREFDDQADLLAGPDTARTWLSASGLLPAGAPLPPGELERARVVRKSMVSLVVAAPGSDDAPSIDVVALRALIDTHRPWLAIDDGGHVSVEYRRRDDLADGLFALLLIIRQAQEDGTWERLKACGNPECRWVFYDRSRNRQGSWCEMAVCGNRLKNRALRARRR